MIRRPLVVLALLVGFLSAGSVAQAGRLGMYARMGTHYGLFGHIGQVLATNSADGTPGKNTWWTMRHEGSVGLALDF